MNDDKKGYKEWMHEALKSRSEINDLREEIQEQQVLLEHQDKIIRDLREPASHFSEVVSVSLAKNIIDVLETKCLAGCDPKYKNWDGFQNGNGTDVGKHIQRLINRAKRIIDKQ